MVGQDPERRSAIAALVGLGVFTLLVAVVPNAVLALGAVADFVSRPAVAALLVTAGGLRLWRSRPPD